MCLERLSTFISGPPYEKSSKSPLSTVPSVNVPCPSFVLFRPNSAAGFAG